MFPDVVFFNGYRWAMASSADIQISESDSGLSDFFANDFHAFWSTYTVGFLSSPISVDSPDDSNTPSDDSWFQAQGRQDDELVQGPDLSKPVESKFCVPLVPTRPILVCIEAFV